MARTEKEQWSENPMQGAEFYTGDKISRAWQLIGRGVECGWEKERRRKRGEDVVWQSCRMWKKIRSRDAPEALRHADVKLRNKVWSEDRDLRLINTHAAIEIWELLSTTEMLLIPHFFHMGLFDPCGKAHSPPREYKLHEDRDFFFFCLVLYLLPGIMTYGM